MQITNVFGPYKHAGGYRLVIRVDDGRKNSRQFPTEKEALAVKKELIRQAGQQRSLSIEDALGLYEQHLIRKGNQMVSIGTTLTRLRDFFGDLTMTVAMLSPKVCAGRYDDLTTRLSPRTNRPVSADTHRNVLAEARTFLGWTVSKGWLEKNSLQAVKGIGRRTHGKSQLRIDEGKRFADKALELAALGQAGPVAVLVALLMGFRASEIVSREVRDLDDKGRKLVIERSAAFRGKSEAAARANDVPVVLQPHLLRLARGRQPTDKLFGTHKRDWVLDWVHRVCDQAGLPRVTAHALRGMTSTFAVESGVATHAVAAMLGHGSPGVTEKSYIKAGTKEARAQRELVTRFFTESTEDRDAGKL